MELLLKDGDYVPDGKGGFCRVAGAEALLQRTLYLLTVRRGSFPFLPELGSRLYLLLRERRSARAALAQQYAAEALAEIKGLSVQGADLCDRADGKLDLTLRLDWRGEKWEAGVTVG